MSQIGSYLPPGIGISIQSRSPDIDHVSPPDVYHLCSEENPLVFAMVVAGRNVRRDILHRETADNLAEGSVQGESTAHRSPPVMHEKLSLRLLYRWRGVALRQNIVEQERFRLFHR